MAVTASVDSLGQWAETHAWLELSGLEGLGFGVCKGLGFRLYPSRPKSLITRYFDWQNRSSTLNPKPVNLWESISLIPKP